MTSITNDFLKQIHDESVNHKRNHESMETRAPTDMLSPEDLIKRQKRREKNQRRQQKRAKDREESFLVEEVLLERHRKGQIEYFVKWLEYPDTENSWLTVKDLRGSKKFIEYLNLQSIKRAEHGRRRNTPVTQLECGICKEIQDSGANISQVTLSEA